MRFSYFKPSGLLAQFVRHYWVLEADANEGSVSEYIIPTGNIEMMFHFQKPFIAKQKEQIVLQPKSFVSGLNSNQSEVTTQGESGLIAATFFPHGAGNFLPFPLIEAEDKNLCLRDVFNKEVRQLEEQMSDTFRLEQKVALLETFLLRRYQPVRITDLTTICAGVKMIDTTRGTINSAQLSDKLFVSPKNLERKFSALLGKTPKQYIRIVRFQHILKSMFGSPRTLTQLAYEFCYFDQAHFIKDFKSLSGLSPREFQSRYNECPNDYFME